jgi:hypothetical protein
MPGPKSSTSLLAALALALLGAQCEPRPAPVPNPEPLPPAPTETAPSPAPTAPPTSPSPEPDPPPVLDAGPPTSRCELAWTRALALGCPPLRPACDAGVLCVGWLEFCETVEANGVSAGSACLMRAEGCNAVAACIGR